MKRFAQIIAMLLCLAMVLTACGGGNASSTASTASSAASTASSAASSTASGDAAASTKADKDSLTYAVAAEPGKIDPQNNGILPGICMEKQVYDTLIYKTTDGKFVEGLATAWEWIDATHLSLTLREGVKFHNGNEFNADDVLFTLSRLPGGAATASLYAAFDPANSTSDGPNQVTIAFKYAFAPAMNFIAHTRFAIVDKEFVEENGEEILNQSAMGTGAFKFVEWVIGSHAKFERNEEYWGQKAGVKNLTFRFMVEDTARMVALETGEVDIASELSATDLARLQNGEVPGVSGYSTPSYKVWYLEMNEAFEPFQNKNVRLAMAHAVDWAAACEAAAQGVIEPATSCLASTIMYYKNVGIYEYDVEKAKQLMKDAGYENGFTVTCVEEEIPVAIRMLEIVQMYLAEIGITMEIQAVDTATWSEGRLTGTTMLSVGNMTAMTGDPMHTLNGTIEDQPQISSRCTDPKYNELFHTGAAEMDDAKRGEIYAELQQYVYDNAIQIPMYQQIITYGAHDYCQGFIPDAGLQLDLKLISIA